MTALNSKKEDGSFYNHQSGLVNKGSKVIRMVPT